MDFIGRKKELETLSKEYDKNTSFVVVYGRRRVGKTCMIRRFIEDKNSIYFQVTQETISSNLMQFSEKISEHLGLQGLSFSTWQNAFDAVTKNEKIVIVIDEFQYLASSDNSFPSVLQSIWDNILSDRNVMLILCGSHIGMMEKYTLNYSSPLYGRRTSVIKLRPLSFSEIREAYPDRSMKDAIEEYAITGGIPKYMEIFDKPTLKENIFEYVYNSNGFLFEEPAFLLKNEVRDVVNYNSILRSIALGNRKLSSISGRMEVSGNTLSPYLNTLIDLGILERRVPITESNPERSRNGLYIIKDRFFAFWFAFVYPYRSFLESGDTKEAEKRFDEHFIDSYVSFVFEDICREYIRDNLTGYQRIGSYWNKDVEIDIVAVDDERKRLFVGECKYLKNKVTMSVLNELKDKCSEVVGFKEYSISYGLFSISGFDENLMNMAKNEGVMLVDMG